MKEAKQNGFSDLQIAELIHSTESEVRIKTKITGCSSSRKTN